MSPEEKLSRRFYILNAVVALILLFAIFISVNQFGAQAWQQRQQIAVILPGKKDQLGWNKSHYLAAKNSCDDLDCDLIIRENVPSDTNSCRQIADELSKRGVKTIVFVNACRLNDLIEFERIYPKINFYTIESISVLYNGEKLSVTCFEASYLAGILAGLHTKTNKIGYIAPFADSEINQGINAFTIGVKRVNPDAEILLNWTGSFDNPLSEEQTVQNLKAAHADFLTYHQNGETIPNVCARLGINFVSFNEVYPNNPKCLAAIKINWDKIYNNLIKYKDIYDMKSNYSAGINHGMVDFQIIGELSKREKILIETALWEIKNGRLIFSGEIFDRNGNQRCAANESISLKSLQENMNWLVKGVKIVGN